MASSSICSTLLFSLSLAALLSNPSHAKLRHPLPEGEPEELREIVTIHVLNSICSKSKDIHFCLNTLKTDPHWFRKDVQSLGEFSIQLALNYAKETSYAIHSMIKAAPHANVRKSYRLCDLHYKEAIDLLEKADEFLKLGDHRRLSTQALLAVTEASICERRLTSSPEIQSSPIQERNHRFMLHCRVVKAIGMHLRSN